MEIVEVSVTTEGNTPKGWKATTLGKLGRYLNGRGFKRSEWGDKGLPIIRIQNLTGSGAEFNYYEGEIDERHVAKTGDLLVSWAATLDAFIWDGPKAAVNQHIFKVETFIDKMFHYYLIKEVLEELYNKTHGSGMVHVTRGVFDNTPVAIPGEKEQRRIVEAIELQLGRLDVAVAGLQAAKAKLKRYKQAVLKAAVEGAIENGEMVPLKDLITSIGQGWSPKCLNTPSPNYETWGVIKTTAIQPGSYAQEANKELPKKLKPRPEHELQIGDLLITRAGPRSRVGITCLVRETRPRLMNCDKAYRLRFDEKRVDPAYVEMLLNSPQITDQLDELKTGISDSGVNLTQGRFLILEMPVIGLKEQLAMIQGTQEATTSIEEMETTLDAQLAQSTRLRQSVLKRAFEGRLV